MSTVRKAKTFADCFTYWMSNEGSDSEFQADRALQKYIMTAQRIDRSSEAFKNIVVQLKARAQTALVIKMLNHDMINICIADKELPAGFKVFRARDLKSDKKTPKIFIDVTGLFSLKNGYFYCADIDKFAAYLYAAMAYDIYYRDPQKIMVNGNLQKSSTVCYIRLLSSVIDNFRLPNYNTNKNKIQYLIGVFFAYSVIRLDIAAAQNVATSALGFNRNETKGYDWYYTEEDDFTDIKSFVVSLAKTFKLEGLTPDVLINKWIYVYGKGTQFALELYPAFLTMLLYAYSGSYLNNVKRIESVCGREMITVADCIKTIGSSSYDRGFKYESYTIEEAQREHDKYMKIINEKTDDLDAEEVTNDTLDNRDLGIGNGEETKELTDEVKKDVELENSAVNESESLPSENDLTKNITNKGIRDLVDKQVADPEPVNPKDTVVGAITDPDNHPDVNVTTTQNTPQPTSIDQAKTAVQNTVNNAKSGVSNFVKNGGVIGALKNLFTHEDANKDLDPHEISQKYVEDHKKIDGVADGKEADELKDGIKKDVELESADEISQDGSLDGNEIAKDEVEKEEDRTGTENNDENQTLSDEIEKDEAL